MKCIPLILFGSLVGCATTDRANDGFRGAGAADDPWGWSHVVLESEDAVGISIDYVSAFHRDTTSIRPTNVDFADPLYANVWADSLTGDETVRVVLMNYYQCDRAGLPYSYVLDLTWRGDHFSGNVGEDATVERGSSHFASGERFVTRWSGYGGDHPWCQDVAVVVDNAWQRDPISGTNNFSFDMYQRR